MPTDWFKQKLRSSVSCSLLEEGVSEAWSGLNIEGVAASKLSRSSMERNESTLDKIASMLSSTGVSSGEGDEGKGASLKRFTEPSKETVMSFWSFCTQNKCVISPRCFPLFVEFQKERALQTVVRVFHQSNELSSDRTPTPNRMIASSRKQKRSARRRSEGCDIALMAA